MLLMSTMNSRYGVGACLEKKILARGTCLEENVV